VADRKRGTGRPVVRRPAQRSTPFRAALPVAAPEPTAICRFLASEEPDGTLGPPLGVVDPRHRCVAMTEAVAQSPQQQHLVCLTSGHVDCPRYLRGVLFAGAPPVPARREPVSRAVIGATLVLLGAIAASFGFLAVRGNFDLPVATPTPGQVAAVPSATPLRLPSASVAIPSPSVDPTPSVAPSASEPPPSVEPSATPVPTPVPTPRPTPKPTPRPTSDRFAVLTACPSTPNCWIYVIRSGDNLTSIANWFGVSYNRVIKMNPGLARPIHAGEKLRIPTPTR
jgi:hypothetical protein